MPAGEKGQKKKASKNQILNASFLHNVAPGNSPCASFLAEPLQPLRLLRSSARELTLRFVPGLDFARQPSEIAPTGHTPAQEPQLMQAPEITYAMGKHLQMIFTFLLYHRKLKIQGI